MCTVTTTATLPYRTMQHRRVELTPRDLRLPLLAFELSTAGREFVHFGDDVHSNSRSLVAFNSLA